MPTNRDPLKESEELLDRVLLYLTTEDGRKVWILLAKLDRYCTNWMHGLYWNRMKKEIFVQIIEKFHTPEDPFVPSEDLSSSGL